MQNSYALEHHHIPRKHAGRRRLRRRMAITLFFILFVILATVVLNLFIEFGTYHPRYYEPKDFEREQRLKG